VRISGRTVRTSAVIPNQESSVDVLALHESLDRLDSLDPQLARIVELRFFGGLTVEETAEVLDVSPATIKRNWSMAKAWLRNEMEKSIES